MQGLMNDTHTTLVEENSTFNGDHMARVTRVIPSIKDLGSHEKVKDFYGGDGEAIQQPYNIFGTAKTTEEDRLGSAADTDIVKIINATHAGERAASDGHVAPAQYFEDEHNGQVALGNGYTGVLNPGARTSILAVEPAQVTAADLRRDDRPTQEHGAPYTNVDALTVVSPPLPPSPPPGQTHMHDVHYSEAGIIFPSHLAHYCNDEPQPPPVYNAFDGDIDEDIRTTLPTDLYWVFREALN
ncbi:hypothetical protein EXIGLDRAFT_835634 [Exidia glandulosa HHB12029]|uniref:Uncharacterized protein n=1 Tax=Exidia glandulosa HHB12029 TaxID=1314781 RepID=A0A165ILH4_EXIGL|nr:hypothetical protein EXIGLDRAFT_835634 [Exidia glandulosa HHB12029]